MFSNSYTYKINGKLSEKDLIRLQQIHEENPNIAIVITYKNTCNLTVDDVDFLYTLPFPGYLFIKIVGAYDEEKLKSYPEALAQRRRVDNIYSLDETRKILFEINKIEQGLMPGWSDGEKLIYFINYLKKNIIYHPFHEDQPSSEIRSLRGLISGMTVCAGYALILKELCDRNGIQCEFVSGSTKKENVVENIHTHAWNIVKLKGSYIPVDLTWNAGNVHKGRTLSIQDIANVNEFIKNHYPALGEPIQDYEKTLKSLDSDYIREVNEIIDRNEKLEFELGGQYRRSDGSVFSLKLLEEVIEQGEHIFKYLLCEVRPNGISQIEVLYSKTNVDEIRYLLHNREKLEKSLEDDKILKDPEKVKQIKQELAKTEWVNNVAFFIKNTLFSKSNIVFAANNSNCYVGELDFDINNNIIGTKIDIDFGKKLNVEQDVYNRNDGSAFLLEKKGIFNFKNNNLVYAYNYYEINHDNKSVNKSTVFSDNDLLNLDKNLLANQFLSKRRLKKSLKVNHGYLGGISKNGVIGYIESKKSIITKELVRTVKLSRKDLVSYFKEINISEMKKLIKSFSYRDIGNKIQVINNYSGKIIRDKDLLLRYKFSSIWLKAAGLYSREGERIEGYGSAFLDPQIVQLFLDINKLITDGINNNGNIDTVSILWNIIHSSNCPNAKEIVVRLFSSKENIDVIDSVYRKQNPSCMNATIIPVVFKNMEDAMKKLQIYQENLQFQRDNMYSTTIDGSFVSISRKYW